MLSFTGAWISFPKVFSQFENNPAPAGQSREQAMRARDQQRLAATAA